MPNIWLSCMVVCAHVTAFKQKPTVFLVILCRWRRGCSRLNVKKCFCCFCQTLNAPLNLNSPHESWIICFAPLSRSLFRSLFMHDLRLALFSPLSPSSCSIIILHSPFLPLSILSFTLSVHLSSSLTLWAFDHSLLLFLPLTHALNSAAFSTWLTNKLNYEIKNEYKKGVNFTDLMILKSHYIKTFKFDLSFNKPSGF